MDVSPRTPFALSWSGGKDSALALSTLRGEGREPEALITTVTGTYDRISMHGVRRELLARQASALGIPLVEVVIPPKLEQSSVQNLQSGRELDQWTVTESNTWSASEHRSNESHDTRTVRVRAEPASNHCVLWHVQADQRANVYLPVTRAWTRVDELAFPPCSLGAAPTNEGAAVDLADVAAARGGQLVVGEGPSAPPGWPARRMKRSASCSERSKDVALGPPFGTIRVAPL